MSFSSHFYRQVAAQTSSSTSKEIDEAIMSEERQGSQDGCVHVNKTSLTVIMY